MRKWARYTALDEGSGGRSKGGWVGVLKVIVICQLFSGHNSLLTSEQCHARLPGNSPLLHRAVRFARMVDEARHGASCCIDDHVLIEVHEIVALLDISIWLVCTDDRVNY